MTWARLRRGEFVKLRPDTYVGSLVPIDVAVRVQGLAVWAGPGAVVAGPSAALAWEVDCPWDDEEVVLPGAHRRDRGGVTVRQDLLLPDEVTWRHQARVTTPPRTAFDLGRRSSLVEAVAAVDALAHAWGFGRDELAAVAAAHPRARGLVQVRAVLDLMDPLAESLPESRMRVGLVARGVPRPVSRFPVRLPSGRRARLDLAWPTRRRVDGRWRWSTTARSTGRSRVTVATSTAMPASTTSAGTSCASRRASWPTSTPSPCGCAASWAA